MTTVTLTQNTISSTVAGNDIVLVDFWASWCGPCRMFAPIYEKAADANPDLVFGSVNVDEEQALSAAAQVTSIPTLMAFKGGQLVHRQAGAVPARELDRLIAALRGARPVAEPAGKAAAGTSAVGKHTADRAAAGAKAPAASVKGA